jgi:hypothetical protein
LLSWLPAVLAATAMLTLTPAATLAADEEVKPDARELGFLRDVALPQSDRGGAALSYFILIGTTVLAVGVLFKNANRTHLD